MAIEITPLTDPDVLVAINNSTSDLNIMTVQRATWLVEHMVMPGLVTLDGQTAGMIVVLDDTSGYDSDYYRWFTARYGNFLYIDRVTVNAALRGQGIAKQIYQVVDQVARERQMAVVADVHCEPPNTPSINLHQSMGFQEVGRQHFPEKQKVASKFMKYANWAEVKPAAD